MDLPHQSLLAAFLLPSILQFTVNFKADEGYDILLKNTENLLFNLYAPRVCVCVCVCDLDWCVPSMTADWLLNTCLLIAPGFSLPSPHSFPFYFGPHPHITFSPFLEFPSLSVVAVWFPFFARVQFGSFEAPTTSRRYTKQKNVTTRQIPSVPILHL